MKTFYELTATPNHGHDLDITLELDSSSLCEIILNGQAVQITDQVVRVYHGLLDPLHLEIQGGDVRQITIDGFDILPAWHWVLETQPDRTVLSIREPFYRWRHRITGQGWLLEP